MLGPTPHRMLLQPSLPAHCVENGESMETAILMKFSDTLRGIGNPVAYYPGLAKVVGGVTSALFLCQINYWGNKGHTGDGWIYKTQEELTTETGLTRSEQETARKNLKKLGVLEEQSARLEHRLYYRVNDDALDALWEATFANAENLHSGTRETSSPEVAKPASVSLTKTTTETTTETTDTATPSFVKTTMDTLESIRGYASTSYGAEAKAIKEMKRLDYTAGEIMDCYVDRKKDSWWKDKPLTMMVVKSAIGEWKKNSRPKRSEGRETFLEANQRIQNDPEFQAKRKAQLDSSREIREEKAKH